MSGQDMRKLMEMSYNNRGWTIMNAKALFERPRSSLQQIMEEWNDGTVMVVSVESPSYNKPDMKRFIAGSGSSTYAEVGYTTPWTNDTGNGYRLGTSLTVENYFVIKDKQIVEQANNIGLNEKRPVWVFK